MQWKTLGVAAATLALGAGLVVIVNSPPEAAFAQTKKKTPAKKAPVRKPAPTPIVLPPLAAPMPLPEPPQGGNILGVGAGIYTAYANDVAVISADTIRDEASLRAAMEVLTRHPSERLAKGWVAYGALVMSQSDVFVTEVRRAAAYYGRDVMLTGFRNDIRYARTIPGAAQAVDLAQRAMADDAARLDTIAAQFKAYSYQVQKQSWAQARAADPRAAADAVRSRSAVIATPIPETVLAMGAPPPENLTPAASLAHRSSFWAAYKLASMESRLNPLSGTGPVPDPVVATGGVVDRMATLAAMHALGADRDYRPAMENLLNYRSSSNCFESARLNTVQCVAAGRFQYEQVFCLAEHPLREIAACIKGAARL